MFLKMLFFVFYCRLIDSVLNLLSDLYIVCMFKNRFYKYFVILFQDCGNSGEVPEPGREKNCCPSTHQCMMIIYKQFRNILVHVISVCDNHIIVVSKVHKNLSGMLRLFGLFCSEISVIINCKSSKNFLKYPKLENLQELHYVISLSCETINIGFH